MIATLEEMKLKILSGRNLFMGKDYLERDFKTLTLDGVATVNMISDK